LKKVIVLLTFALLTADNLPAQDKNLFRENFLKADYFFLTEEYEEALHMYSELLKTDPTNYNLKFLTGACYLSLYGMKRKAIPFLEEAVTSISAGYREGSYKERNAPRESLFALARVYHIDNQFDKAIEYYESYRNAMIKQKFADIEYVNAQIKSCELAKYMIKKPIEVRFLDPGSGLNLYSANYNPVFSGNDSVIIYMADKPFYSAILMSQRSGERWSDPVILNVDLGSDGDCYPTSLSFDGKELYLVKKNYSEADIYVSRFSKGHWTKIEKLNGNINTEYYESHACVSANGRKLFFTSDRPGGYGAMDIWVSEKSKGGDWEQSRNLGPEVNSFYSEETPYITNDEKKLFFSSQGHATMGGYDIFISALLPDGTWSFPENIGYPVSTSDDDLFYVPRRNGEWGYFSTIIDTLSVNRNIYAVRIGPQEDIQIEARKREEKVTDTIKEKYLASGDEQEKKTKSQEHLPADQYYILNSILFEFDRYDLDEEAQMEADRILEVLLKYPDIQIELTGHTDALGADEYNRRLSKNRAAAVADYLTKHGVSSGRITVKGIGEAEPVAINKYEDGTDSPEGRRLNRHVSIRLSNLQDENVSVAEIFVPQKLKPGNDLSYSVLLVTAETMTKDMPEKIGEEQVALIITDQAFLYTAGNFDHKADAIRLLNDAIDKGFPEAKLMEQENLEDLIRSLSDSSLPVSVTFTIQIMALKNPVRTDYFRDVGNVTMFRGRDGLHRYVYGDFQSISEALKELPRIQNMGYKDAFIMYMARYKKAAAG
jgi:outer membrane protein OmpA-like peptidoglycan-associated protein